jgi:hypothetical protein
MSTCVTNRKSCVACSFPTRNSGLIPISSSPAVLLLLLAVCEGFIYPCCSSLVIWLRLSATGCYCLRPPQAAAAAAPTTERVDAGRLPCACKKVTRNRVR